MRNWGQRLPMPTKSMVTKGDSCNGGKNAKDRITVLLKPLVIGKSKKPQCFYGFEVASLGFDYDFSKKAWMTTSIFTTWLNQLNNRMRFEQRRILMFVDNCAAHPDVQLSYVKLVFPS